jgi:hypothetical protein
MPIGEAVIHVECDKCGEVTDPMDLCSLAGGGWDARYIKERIKKDGWLVDGHTTICPECRDAMAGDNVAGS